MADIKKAMDSFKKHGFDTIFFETQKEVKEYLANELKQKLIAFGGSITLQEMGLFEELSKENTVLWHWKIPGTSAFSAARQAEIYITSANAVSETGEIVNIDGTGNRTALSMFGPQVLYYVVGKNKLAPTLQDAIHRAKNVAAPRNAKRLNKETPCAKNADKCYDCQSPQRICRATAITERRPLGIPKVEIIFVNEDMGY